MYVTTSVRPTGGATTNVARDGDWASPRTLGTAQDEFPIDQRYDAAMRVPMDDTLDIPIDLVNEAAFFNARDMAEAVDAQVYKEVLDNVEAAQGGAPPRPPRPQTGAQAKSFLLTKPKSPQPAHLIVLSF